MSSPVLTLNQLAQQLNLLGVPTTETSTGLIVQQGQVSVPVTISQRGLNLVHRQLRKDGHPTVDEATDALIGFLIELVETCPPSGRLDVQRRGGRWELHRNAEWTTPPDWPTGDASWSANSEDNR